MTYQKIKCKGHSKRTGELCGNYAMQGQLVCASHGGKNPQAMANGQVVVAQREMVSLGLRTDVEPHVALLEAIREAHGNVDFYRGLVAEPDTRTAAMLKAYNEERDRLVDYINIGLKLGIAKARLEAETSEIVIAWAD